MEQNCIISKDADITVAFEVELRTLHRDGRGAEAIPGCWCKAIRKVLPDFSVVHKQDWTS